MRSRPPRPWHTVGSDFMQFHSEHLLVVVDYLTGYIWTHTFRSTPSSQQTIDALDLCARTNGGYFSILASDGGPQFSSAQFKQWLTDKYIIHRLSSSHFPQSNGRVEKAVAELRTMFDRAEAEKGCRLNAGEKAELVAIYNDTPRRDGAASPSRLHFRRQYRHPGLPAMDLAVWEAGEEVLEWHQKEKRKESILARSSGQQRKPLRLSVGLKVLCMDKEGVYSLPGEIVGLRSQRSCWVLMEDSGRTLLRNRKFLQADPTFSQPKVYSLVVEEGGNSAREEVCTRQGGAALSAKSILRGQAQCQRGKQQKRVSFVLDPTMQPSAESPRQPSSVAARQPSAAATAVGTQLSDSFQVAESLRQPSSLAARQPQLSDGAEQAGRRRTWAQVAGDSSEAVVPRLRRRIQELEEENRQLQRVNSIWREASSSEHSREVIQAEGHQESLLASGGEEESDEDGVWGQEVVSEPSEDELGPEDVDSDEERELAEEAEDREVVDQFIEAFAAHNGAAVPQEVRDRLLESAFSVREDSHSVQCKHCSRLSAVFPFYVRSCIVPGRDEVSDLISFSTYSCIPGNEIFASFQREFFGSIED